MALPPGFLDELRARLTLSEVAGGKVAWDRRKSNPARGDFWAPCPFHQEKTPSFHVDDAKGFYYCFGCHAKGDLITFVKETENLSFIEAVERLAGMAGLEMPAERDDPGAAERRDRLTRLADVMEQAVQLFRQAFRAGAGQRARDYAASRGLAEETLARFEIGFAPEGRTRLAGHFRDKGMLEEAIAAGLVIAPEDGGAPYDRFRDRLMFPIRDARGRCIAFGGRALSPEARAKYLNSPETELFHKGRVLFNERLAREAAGKAGRLVVAEGYMDVVALAAAGFEAAVAPMGTAITEDQLGRLWRISGEPVVALDGDAAGLRAGRALVDVALPHLAPGRSLGFCLLPEGKDPDDVIREGGPGAMAEALEGAVPLIDMLWSRELAQHPLDTPERRAAFEARWRAATARISDRGVRQNYEQALVRRQREHFWALDRPKGRPGARGRGRGPAPAPGASPETRATALARAGAPSLADEAREATILLIAYCHPEAAAAVEAALEDLPVATPALEPVRAALIEAIAEGAEPATHAAASLGADPLERLRAVGAARAHPMAARRAETEAARAELDHLMARHRAARALAVEAAEAREGLADGAGAEDGLWRLRQLAVERQRIDAEGARRVGPASEPSTTGAVASMLSRLEAGAYRGKKRRKPPSNQS